MSGSQIAAEVAAALREVARDVGDGAFIVTLLRGPDEPETPWDAFLESPRIGVGLLLCTRPPHLQ